MKKRLLKKLLKQALCQGTNTPRHRAAITEFLFMAKSKIDSLPKIFNDMHRGIEKMNVFLARSK